MPNDKEQRRQQRRRQRQQHWLLGGCCLRFKMGLFVPCESQRETEMASNNHHMVKVQLYGQREKLQIAWHDQLTAETVGKVAAAKCSIQCLSSTLFSIYDKDTNTWLSPPTKLKDKSEVIFRFRFHVVTDAHSLNSYEEQVLVYLYEQFHDDFIQGCISNLSTEDRLGLIVISILQHYEGQDVMRGTADSHFKSFVPKEWFRGLNTIDKHRLKQKVKSSLKKFTDEQGDSSTCYRLMFLASLIDNKPTLIAEQFQVTIADKPCTVLVSKNKGIEIEKQCKSSSTWNLMHLTDINLYSRSHEDLEWTVQLNRRNGCPEFLQLKTRQEAVSLVTLLDGYYRLLVDYYHFLCKELAPPSLDLLTKNRCHGPIPRKEALDRLTKAGLEDGTYLIRQNPEKYDSYCLSVVYGRELKNYKIKINEDGRVSLTDHNSFESLRALMEFYRNANNCWCLEGPLKKCITSSSSSGISTDNSLLITSRTGGPAPPNSPIPERKNVTYIRESDLSSPNQWRPLGNGKFLEVKLGELRRSASVRTVNVVIKMPSVDAPTDFNKMFSQLADRRSGLKHPHIVRFEGISVYYISIFEYADQGPLDRFLHSRKKQLKKPHLLQAATQIADALEFLEKKQIVHGSLGAHNVLVTHLPPNFIVKLTDLMIGDYYYSNLPINHPVRLKRVRWTAPELLRGPCHPTMYSDIFSYGVLLWQIVAYGQRPLDGIPDEQVRKMYLEGHRPKMVEDCPDDLAEIVKKCWMYMPSNRPCFRDVLRDVRQVMLMISGQYAGDKDNSDSFIYTEPIPTISVRDEEEDDGNGNEVENANSSITHQLITHGNPKTDMISDAPVNGDEFHFQLMPTPPQTPEVFHPNTCSPTQSPVGNAMLAYPVFEPEDVEDPISELKIDNEFNLLDISNDDLEIGKKLGEGFYGVVHQAIWRTEDGFTANPRKKVAVKMLKEKHYHKYYEAFKKEIQWMGSLDHDNIVKVLGVCKGRYIRLVLEFVPLGALKLYLKDKKPRIPTETLYLFCTQICDAMHYLGHDVSMRIVHRDLAARNILVATERHVKITDFGLAKCFGTDRDYYVVKGSEDMPYKWYAPECIGHQKFSCEGDVWSFGVLMWEIFTYGAQPVYYNVEDKEVPVDHIFNFLDNGGRLRQANTPTNAYSIMNNCWQKERTDRPTFSALSTRCQRLMGSQQLNA